jgi:hypothetical protein
MFAGIRITVRNEDDEVIEYCTGASVLQIDVPEGRYVITVSEAHAPAAQEAPACGRLQ